MTALSSPDNAIPLFSLAQLLRQVAGAKNGQSKNGLIHDCGLVRDFVHCLTTKGVFYLSDCGLDEPEHAAARGEVMDLIRTATPEQKRALTTTQRAMRRGFLDLEGESTAKSTNSGTFSDYAVAYSMGEHSNVFPPERPRFQAVWAVYFQQLRKMAHALLDATGVLFGFESPTPCDDLLRFRYYPDLPESRAAEKVPFRVAAHHDVSVFTFIHQTPCPNGFVSLQCDVNGVYCDIPTIPGTVVVQVGAVLSTMTEGRIKSPKHRIKAAPQRLLEGSSRSASVYHIRPGPDFPIRVAVAHRLNFGDQLKGDIAPFSEWLGGNYSRIHKGSKL